MRLFKSSFYQTILMTLSLILYSELSGFTTPAQYDTSDTTNLKPYLGSYTANYQNFKNSIFEIKNRDGLLTLKVPDRGEMQFDYPDESGFWFYRISKFVALTFDKDDNDRVIRMILHQTTPVPRVQDISSEIPAGIPEEVRPLLGSYRLEAAGVKFRIFIQDNSLSIDTGTGTILKLQPPTNNGIWGFGQGSMAAISFGSDEDGIINTLNLHQSFEIPKGFSAALVVEAEINSKGLEAGLNKMAQLQSNQEYFINEADFNALGYRFLEQKKIKKAIAVFKINVDAYPESFNAFDSLGEAYMENGNIEQAILNYRKSLELNPNNEAGRKMLHKLGGI